MKSHLLDVNLLIALAWPSHVHHAQAHRWFKANAHHGWATCPFTQCGFVRVSSNPAAIPDAVTPLAALEMLRRIVAGKHHIFWPADLDLADASAIPLGLLVGHRQVADAYLLGLAISKRGKLATLDKRIHAIVPSSVKAGDVVEFVSVE